LQFLPINDGNNYSGASVPKKHSKTAATAPYHLRGGFKPRISTADFNPIYARLLNTNFKRVL
jgi:hypothetical protein